MQRHLPLGTLMLLAACAVEPFDVRLVNGAVHIGVDGVVDSLAIRGDRIVALGPGAAEGPARRVVDLRGAHVYPGFQDAHVHLLAGNFALDRLLLMGASSMASMNRAAVEYAAEAPDEPWIVGYGWLAETVDDPTGLDLSMAIPDRPVLLMSNSGHEAVVNAVALELAGIDADTLDPVGGRIVRDPESGVATGYLVEAAVSLVAEQLLADYDDLTLSGGLRERLESFSSAGITGISEILAVPGFNIGRPWIYTQLEASGDLPIRVSLYFPIFSVGDVDAAADDCESVAGTLVRCAGGKVWVDGSMGSAEAWVEEPYGAEPAHLGTHYFSVEELVTIVRTAESRGMALKFHVNGDAAVDATLTALETVAEETGLAQTHVLDHVVLTDPDDAARMSILGVVVSVQPSHFVAAQFGETARLLGERFDTAYDFRSFLDRGVPLAMGTDWPVWPVADPLIVAWNAASLPSERAFTIGEALTAYSTGSSAAIGLGDELGRLDVGMLADFVVMDGDLSVAPLAEVPDRVIEQVWVGGRQVR